MGCTDFKWEAGHHCPSPLATALMIGRWRRRERTFVQNRVGGFVPGERLLRQMLMTLGQALDLGEPEVHFRTLR